MFHLFPALPAELRLHIWSLSLVNIEPVVGISCERGVHPNSRRFARLFRASRGNPPQLRVNREARHEALRVYIPYFCTEHAPFSRIYLAPDRDIVRLPDALLGYLGTAELMVIRRLIVEVSDYMFFGSYWMDVLRKMGSLVELKLVVVLNLPVYTISDDMAEVAGLNNVQTHSLAVLKEAFVEGMRASPGWILPKITVVSDTGIELGEITIHPEDIEDLTP